MSRRALLRSVFAGAVAATSLTTVTAATAAPGSGSTTVQTWTWTRLPNGLEVHCTDATGRKTTAPVAVSWTADGQVTATYALPLTTTAGHVTMAGGYGLAVRRAG